MVLHFEALVTTAQHIANHRKGAPRDRALGFLELLETWHLVLIGMLADANDETPAITHMFDAEDFEAAEGKECTFFSRPRIGSLLVAHVWHWLTKPRMTTGSNQLVEKTYSKWHCRRCLSVMQNWLRLLYTSISAEFPDWQVQHSLGCFSLDSEHGSLQQRMLASRHSSLSSNRSDTWHGDCEKTPRSVRFDSYLALPQHDGGARMGRCH